MSATTHRIAKLNRHRRELTEDYAARKANWTAAEKIYYTSVMGALERLIKAEKQRKAA